MVDCYNGNNVVFKLNALIHKFNDLFNEDSAEPSEFFALPVAMSSGQMELCVEDNRKDDTHITVIVFANRSTKFFITIFPTNSNYINNGVRYEKEFIVLYY